MGVKPYSALDGLAIELAPAVCDYGVDLKVVGVKAYSALDGLAIEAAPAVCDYGVDLKVVGVKALVLCQALSVCSLSVDEKKESLWQ